MAPGSQQMGSDSYSSPLRLDRFSEREGPGYAVTSQYGYTYQSVKVYTGVELLYDPLRVQAPW